MTNPAPNVSVKRKKSGPSKMTVFHSSPTIGTLLSEVFVARGAKRKGWLLI
jgi:hypothetical protein